MAEAPTPTTSDWRPSACILCECNCGIEVQLGGDDGRRLARVRGDKAHPSSEGYACEKPSRLDFYQSDPERYVVTLLNTEYVVNLSDRQIFSTQPSLPPTH